MKVSQTQIRSEQLVCIPALSCSDQAQGFFRVPQKALVTCLTSPKVPLSSVPQLLTLSSTFAPKQAAVYPFTTACNFADLISSFSFYDTAVLVLSTLAINHVHTALFCP